MVRCLGGYCSFGVNDFDCLDVDMRFVQTHELFLMGLKNLTWRGNCYVWVCLISIMGILVGLIVLAGSNNQVLVRLRGSRGTRLKSPRPPVHAACIQTHDVPFACT